MKIEPVKVSLLWYLRHHWWNGSNDIMPSLGLGLLYVSWEREEFWQTIKVQWAPNVID